jgi:uncharacterized membrane protein
MALLILGMVIFLSAHLIPSFVELRKKFAGWKGEDVYSICYSLVSALGIGLIVAGKATAPDVPIWEAPHWMNHLTMTAMLPAVILLAAEYLPNNLRRFVRHPFLWGFALWAVFHLLVTGNLGSLILFGGIGAFAVFDMWSANHRGAQNSDKKVPLYMDVLLISVGLIAYGVALYAHPYIFGVSVLP